MGGWLLLPRNVQRALADIVALTCVASQAVDSESGEVVDETTLRKPAGWHPSASGRLRTIAMFHANYTPARLHFHRCSDLASEVLGSESSRMPVTWRSFGRLSGQVLGVTQPILPVLAHLAAHRRLQFVRWPIKTLSAWARVAAGEG